MQSRWTTTLAAAAVLAAAVPLVAQAAELPEITIKVVGNYSNLLQTKEVEKPFWTEMLAKDSDGRITADYNTQDILGIKDFSLLRLTQAGVADVGVGDISKMAGRSEEHTSELQSLMRISYAVF